MPRDMRTDRALIVTPEILEAMDIAEHLAGQGWGSTTMVSTSRDALAQFGSVSDPSAGYSLAVIGVGTGLAETVTLVSRCRDDGIAILQLNGMTSSTMSDGIMSLARPFTTYDLDEALTQLGFRVA